MVLNGFDMWPQEVEVEDAGEDEGQAENSSLVPMRSARFLVLHSTAHTFLLAACSTYLLSGDQPLADKDALVVPQVDRAVLVFTTNCSC